MNHPSHISGPQLDRDLELEADIVIIGSGAGGATSADILSAAGFKVIIVEAGPYAQKKDFHIDESWSYPYLYQDVASRKTSDKAIAIYQGRNVGGGTTVNWTASFRAPEQTLQYWHEKFSVNALMPQDLEPHYHQVEKRLNISPWQQPHNRNNQLLRHGMDKLGWHNDVIARNVKGCESIGACGLGCPIDAKQSMLVTSIPAALQRGALLLSGVRAQNLHQQGDKIAWLDTVALKDNYSDASLYRVRIKAKQFIVAGGAINSPALLMQSSLPDPYDTLGKRIFLHPTLVSIAAMKDPVHANSGAPQSIYSDEFLWKGGVYGEMGYKLEVPPIYPLLAATVIYPWGSLHQQIMQDLPNAHAQIALLRDGFNDEEEGAELKLSDDGYPLISYQYTERLWRGVRNACLSMAEAQFAAGARYVMPAHADAIPYTSWTQARQAINELSMAPLSTQLFSAHQMGGCTMGEDERRSVVNSEGKHHQLANLYVFDGSIFPSGLGVNPQLSIYAIANKLSSQLV
jgi:choline dehydrogenase-like flavoprotein